MKTRLFIVLFAISIFTGCNNSEKKKDKPALKKAIPEAKYETLSSRIVIGDNNKDGKDELAVVIAYCDFSMLNSCKIYSLCDSEWTILNKFSVYEGAFAHEENEKPDPNKITDYLERKNEKWFYADYLEVLNAEDTLSKMKPLILKKCN